MRSMDNENWRKIKSSISKNIKHKTIMECVILKLLHPSTERPNMACSGF